MLKRTFIYAGAVTCPPHVIVSIYTENGKLSNAQKQLIVETVSGSYVIKYAFIDKNNKIELLMQEDFDKIFSKNTNN